MGARASHKYPLSRKEEVEALNMSMNMARNHASRAIHQASNSSTLSAATKSSKNANSDRFKTLFFSLSGAGMHIGGLTQQYCVR